MASVQARRGAPVSILTLTVSHSVVCGHSNLRVGLDGGDRDHCTGLGIGQTHALAGRGRLFGITYILYAFVVGVLQSVRLDQDVRTLLFSSTETLRLTLSRETCGSDLLDSLTTVAEQHARMEEHSTSLPQLHVTFVGMCSLLPGIVRRARVVAHVTFVQVRMVWTSVG